MSNELDNQLNVYSMTAQEAAETVVLQKISSLVIFACAGNLSHPSHLWQLFGRFFYVGNQ